jgi:hypothetical protein
MALALTTEIVLRSGASHPYLGVAMGAYLTHLSPPALPSAQGRDRPVVNQNLPDMVSMST